MKPNQQNPMNRIFQDDKCLSQREISGYLGGTLNKTESYRVENHILDCPLCEDAIEGYDVEDIEYENWSPIEDFEVFAKKLPQQKEAKIRKLSKTFILRRIAAAAVVLLVAVGGFFMLDNPSDGDLYQAYYETYESDLATTRGDSNIEIHPTLLEAMDLYSDGKFQESLSKFEAYKKVDDSSDFADFYFGMASLETGNVATAIEHLQQVKSSGSTYAKDASWYLILAKIKKGKRVEAKELLENYLNNDTVPYRSKGESLLEKI